MTFGESSKHTDQVSTLLSVKKKLVVYLEKVVRELNAGLGVEDGRPGVGEEVVGDDGVLGVPQDALQLALAGLLHRPADVLVLDGPFETF